MNRTKKKNKTLLKTPKMSADTIYTLANWILVGALAVGVIATYAIVASGKIKETELKQELSQAHVRAANAELRAAEANQKAEEEKLARVKIEENIAWRRLSKKQHKILVSNLNKYSDHPVSLWYGAGDKEAETLAWELATVLNDANWNVFSPASMVNLAGAGKPFGSVSRLETGVKITSSRNNTSKKVSQVIVQELLALGFDASVSVKTENSDLPMIWVNVEVRPQGPQGEAKLRKLNDK